MECSASWESQGEPNENPQHEVTLTDALYLRGPWGQDSVGPRFPETSWAHPPHYGLKRQCLRLFQPVTIDQIVVF